MIEKRPPFIFADIYLILPKISIIHNNHRYEVVRDCMNIYLSDGPIQRSRGRITEPDKILDRLRQDDVPEEEIFQVEQYLFEQLT